MFRLFGRKKELDCDHVQSLASDYVDQELDETVLGRVHRHLEFCRPCQAFISSFSKTVRLLRAVPQEQAPDALTQSIVEQTKGKG
jgi:predicted anti-sigma-YlaC factor YlaD